MLENDRNHIFSPQGRDRSVILPVIEQNTQIDKDSRMILELLSDNNLVKKSLPEGPRSLLRSISDALYFTTIYADTIQQMCFTKLQELSQNQQSSNFRLYQQINQSGIILKDYQINPVLPGFDNLTLELVSQIFKVKVIKYQVNEDGYLTSVIINNKYSRQIEIIRTKKSHYESVFQQEFMENATICQSILYDILKNIPAQNSNNQIYSYINIPIFFKNIAFEEWREQQQVNEQVKQQQGVQQIQRSKHKKSFSDTFKIETPQRREYNVFENSKPPENLLQRILQKRKETSGTNLDVLQLIDDEQQYQQQQLTPKSSQSLKSYQRTNHLSIASEDFYVKQQNSQENMQYSMYQEKKKLIILDEGKQRYTGRLKFFDEAKNYGFIILDEDGSDIFVHFDDLQKAGINKELLRSAKNGTVIKLSFGCMNYIGKYNRSRKAVDIHVLQCTNQEHNNIPINLHQFLL